MVDFDTMMLHGLYDVVAIVDTETPQSKAAIKRPPNLPIQVWRLLVFQISIFSKRLTFGDSR